MKKIRVSLFLLLVCATIFDQPRTGLTQTQSRSVKALVGGTLIDGYGSTPLRNSVVIVEGERIKAVGQVGTLAVPAGAEVISTEGMTVLPGLWDMHVHLMINGHSDYAHWDKTYPPMMESVIMPASAKQLLMAGVTSARDLGAPLKASIAVRDRIKKGEIPGPTLYVSGPFIQHEPYPGTDYVRWGVNGVDDARAKVRTLAEAGVDVIKLIDQDQMTLDEVKAIVEEQNGYTTHAGLLALREKVAAGYPYLEGRPERERRGARGLARGAQAIVVSVDYRRAPEASFPAQHDDALLLLTDHAAFRAAQTELPRSLTMATTASTNGGGTVRLLEAIRAATHRHRRRTPSPSNGRERRPRRRNGSSTMVTPGANTRLPSLSWRKLALRATAEPLIAPAKWPSRVVATRGSSSTGIRPGDGKTEWKVDGDLTITGTTRPVTVDLEFLGGAIDPWGNQRIGFSGVVPEVNREDWGLTWNAALETGGFLLSKSVRLEIEAELVKK